MEVNMCYAWDSKLSKRNNNKLFPSSIRGLIIGKSNCGKTTLLLNLLLKPSVLDYDHLYVFGKSLHQKEYQIIKAGFENGLSKEQITNVFENQEVFHKKDINPVEAIKDCIVDNDNPKINAEFFNDCSNIPDPSELNAHDKNLMIFDDCILEKQSKTEAYYTRGRHNNCDSFYISQNYFLLPRKTVRENANFIVLFRQDDKNLNHIHKDHCTDISLDEFKRFCNRCWETKHNFVTIDLSSEKCMGKYRMNFNYFYIPET